MTRPMSPWFAAYAKFTFSFSPFRPLVTAGFRFGGMLRSLATC